MGKLYGMSWPMNSFRWLERECFQPRLPIAGPTGFEFAKPCPKALGSLAAYRSGHSNFEMPQELKDPNS